MTNALVYLVYLFLNLHHIPCSILIPSGQNDFWNKPSANICSTGTWGHQWLCTLKED